MSRKPITAPDIRAMDEDIFRDLDDADMDAMTPEAMRAARTRIEVGQALNRQNLRHMHQRFFTDYEMTEHFRQLAWAKISPYKVKLKEDGLGNVVPHADGRADFVFPEGWPRGIDKDDFIAMWLNENGWEE